MEYYLAIYSSITLVSRVKGCLDHKLGYLSIIRTPTSISKGGCSYSLRFKKKYLKDVIQISSNLDIKIKSIYKEITKNGEKVYYKIERIDDIDLS